MSTEQNRVTEAGIASLAIPDPASVLDEAKNKVHYLWNPFVDINLVGPDGLRFRLGKGWAYYGVGKPGEPLEDYERRKGNLLQRCTAYPVWSIWYKETKYNRGEFSQDEARTGNDLGAVPETEDRQLLAGMCAADWLGRYKDDYGARVLTPFIGMDEAEQKTVAELFHLVQPYAHKLTNWSLEQDVGIDMMDDEETLLFDLKERGPADERIRGAKLDAHLFKIAQDTRRICFGGVRGACITARRDYAELLDQLSNSAMGHKGFKKHSSAYDRDLCYLVGQPVPAAVVSKPQGDPNLGKAVAALQDNVTALTQLAIQQGAPGDESLAEMKGILAEIRAERAKLEKLKKELKG